MYEFEKEKWEVIYDLEKVGGSGGFPSNSDGYQYYQIGSTVEAVNASETGNHVFNTGLLDHAHLVTDVTAMFLRATERIGDLLPFVRFDCCPNITSMRMLFQSSNIDSLPGTFFYGLDHVKDIQGFCDSCTSLKEISENFFKYAPRTIENFVHAFNSCVNLTGHTPKFPISNSSDTYVELWEAVERGILSDNTQGASCFHKCTLLDNYDDIPENWK